MFDIDKETLEIECPNCRFYNYIFFKQIRLRDVIICRGCKTNIQLEDYLNSYRKAERSIRKSIEALESSLKDINITIKI